MLTFDDPPAWMTIEFGPEAFQHGSSCFFDLKEQRGAVATCEQTDRTECSHASDPDRFESYVIERVAVKQAQPLRRKSVLVGGEHALGVDAVPRVALSREVIDQRRLVCDAGPPTLYEMWEIVVLFELLACLGQNGMELPSQRAIFNVLYFGDQLDPAVPDFQR